MAEFAAREPHGIAVVEAAILIETGSYRRFDRIILVTCMEEQQVERALRREGALLADVRARLSRQMPLAEKRKFADFVIDTSGEQGGHAAADPGRLRSITENRIMRVLRPFVWAAVMVAGFLYITSMAHWDAGA